MSDQLGEEVPAETAQAWDSARRVREPVAWILLAVTAIWVLVSAWQLFGLPGAPVPVPASPHPVAVPVGAPGYSRSQSGRGDDLRAASIGCGAAICRRWHHRAAGT